MFAGHVIGFLPLWVANAWRGAVWVGCVLVLAQLVINSNRKGQPSPALVIGRIGLSVFIVADFVTNAERFGEPATWEGLPFTTVGLIFAWWASKAKYFPKIPEGDAPDG